jgi:hypothetical protein
MRKASLCAGQLWSEVPATVLYLYDKHSLNYFPCWNAGTSVNVWYLHKKQPEEKYLKGSVLPQWILWRFWDCMRTMESISSICCNLGMCYL